MKKSISFILILAMVLSLAAPLGVLAEGGSKSQIVFNELKTRYDKLDVGEEIFKTVIDKVIDGNIVNKVYNITEETLDSGKYNKLKEHIKNNLGITREQAGKIINLINTEFKKQEAKDLIGNLESGNMSKKTFDYINSLIDEINDILGQDWANDKLTKSKTKIIFAMFDEVIKNLTVEELSKNGDFKFIINLENIEDTMNNYLVDNVQFKSALGLSSAVNEIVKKLEGPFNEAKPKGTNSLLGDMLVALGGTYKPYKASTDPSKPSDPPASGGGGGGAPGGGGGGGAAPAPLVPGEIVVPKEETEPATATIGKKEITVKTVDKVINVTVKERDAVKAIEALRKEAGKDRESALVVELDNVSGTDLNIELSDKIFVALSKEKVNLNLVANDIEFAIPYNALDNVRIPSGAKVVLRTEGVDKDIAEEKVEEDQDIKKVIDLYLEIIKDDKVTKVSKFKTPVTVKINIRGLGDKDKLAVYYLNEEDNILEFVTGKIVKNQAILRLNHFSKYIILESNKTFEDITNHWARTYVESMVAKNVINGYDDGTFRPDENITRAEFSKMVIQGLEAELVKYNGEFNDVKATDWYADYLATMKKLGLVKGYEDGSFKPNAEITRTEMATILSNIIDIEISKEEVDTALVQFTDKDSIPSWAKDAIAKVVKAKIMVGNNNKFAPVDNTTRAESATTIYRIYNR